jgi:uncharacterized membrane protein YGL010W
VAKNKVTQKNKPQAPKPGSLGFYFDKFAAAHQQPLNRTLNLIFIPLLLFAVFGLIWAVPFPYLKFLGRYNGDFNWSSFLLAFLVYYYIRFSPALGYVVLFVLLLYFYIITQLQQWQNAGGLTVWMISGVLFLISATALFIGYKKEGKKLSFEYGYKNLLIAPLFLVSQVFNRFRIKY